MNGKRLLNFLIWLVLLAGAAVAVGVVLLFYRPEPIQFPFGESLSPPQVRKVEKEVGELRQEVQRVKRYAQAKQPTPFTFRLRDDEINGYFSAHPAELRALNPDLRAVEVHFGPGESISFQAMGTYRGREVVLQAKGQMSLIEGQRPYFTIKEARLGALPLPRKLRKKVAEEINRSLSNQWKKIPPHVRLDSLSSTEGELVLQGQVTARER